MKPRLLDLFCGAGGAAVGYHRAGFDIVGIDINPQPNYPFEFYQMDALDVLRWPLSDFDAVHASPPCQAYASLAAKDGRHPELIQPVRDLLTAPAHAGLPYVIENIVDARRNMHEPVLLCGSMFGLGVRRHRLFESKVLLLRPDCRHRRQGPVRAYYGKPRAIAWKPPGWDNIQKAGRQPLYRGTVQQAPTDMGIDWMTWDELREAIPPAYTQWIGEQLLAHLKAAV
jgi:DNA (cytosine-5)-methyltransferase 1